MIESLFQLLAIYIFAALPCFAGWIANGGKREDIGIPILASILLSLLFVAMLIFSRSSPTFHQSHNNFCGVSCGLHGSRMVRIARSNSLQYCFVSRCFGCGRPSISQACTPL